MNRLIAYLLITGLVTGLQIHAADYTAKKQYREQRAHKKPVYRQKNQATQTNPIEQVPTVKTRDWGQKFNTVAQLFGKATNDRLELKQLRDKYMEQFQNEQQSLKKNPNYMQITANISKDTIAYVQKRIKEEIKKIGTPPTEFCIFSMGSLAREESGFFTDLEIGILVKEKSTLIEDYFRKLIQAFSDRLFLLGEHPDVGGKGLRIDEADIAPIHLKFNMRYARWYIANKQNAFEGSRIFITTPQEFAAMLKPHLLAHQKSYGKHALQLFFRDELKQAQQDNPDISLHILKAKVANFVKDSTQPFNSHEENIIKALPRHIRNVCLLYGSQTLFDEYLTARNKYLNGKAEKHHRMYENRRQEIAFNKMATDIVAFKKSKAISQALLPDMVDIKRELYRFAEQVMTNLGFYHGIHEQNTIKIAQELANKGLITYQVKNHLIELLKYLTGLRLKQQAIFKQQLKAIPTTSRTYFNQRAKLQQEIKRLYSQNTDPVKIAQLKAELKSLALLRPETERSILSPDVLELLKKRYLPMLKNLFELTNQFVRGDKEAFKKAQTLSKR